MGYAAAHEPGTWFVDTDKNPDDYGYVNQGGLSRKVSAAGDRLVRWLIRLTEHIRCGKISLGEASA